MSSRKRLGELIIAEIKGDVAKHELTTKRIKNKSGLN